MTPADDPSYPRLGKPAAEAGEVEKAKGLESWALSMRLSSTTRSRLGLSGATGVVSAHALLHLHGSLLAEMLSPGASSTSSIRGATTTRRPRLRSLQPCCTSVTSDKRFDEEVRGIINDLGKPLVRECAEPVQRRAPVAESHLKRLYQEAVDSGFG